MSKHESIVIRVSEILPHPDPETINLGIVKVFGDSGYQCVVNKNQWKVGDLAAYIEPDTLVDGNREEFSFLNKEGKPPQKHRIKVRKLRGVWSEGFLCPVSHLSLKEGDDAWATLSLERYEPPMITGKNGSRKANLDADFGSGGGWVAAPVRLPFQKYDIENFRKYSKLFEDGEEVVIMEKIHGANFRAVWADEQLFVGSQGGWRGKTVIRPDTGEAMEVSNTWIEGSKQNPWLENLCKENPDVVFFGEVFGQVQDLKYGATKNQVFVRLFDGFSISHRRFLEWNEFNQIVKLEWMAPVLYVGPFSKEIVTSHTDGPSIVPAANHIREGCVVKSTTVPNYGERKILKSVSNLYLERP